MRSWRRYVAYILYLLRHKWWVFLAARNLGVTWLGVVHDLSKFHPRELVPYACNFYHPDGSKLTTKRVDGFLNWVSTMEFKRAWLRHNTTNKHHPQFWLAIFTPPCAVPQHQQYTLLGNDGRFECLECGAKRYLTDGVHYYAHSMPERYMREMMADWIGAGMAQGTPDTKAWYLVRGTHLPFHPKTRAWVEARLGIPSPRTIDTTTSGFVGR